MMDAVSATETAHWAAIAEEAARRGGSFALDNRTRRGEVKGRTHHDVKLQMDVETQQVIETYLREVSPDAAFLGEEGGSLDDQGSGQWIVDPIDGTMNYFHGIPHWCTSVAFQWGGRILAGAVFAPETGECFTATADGPALCNGEPISVSDVDTLFEAVVVTGGISLATEEGAGREAGFLRFVRDVGKVRVLGAAALDLCYMACGRADAIYEYRLHLWDIAAGGLIVERAGGRTLKFDVANPLRSGFLATNGHLEDLLVGTLGVGAVSTDSTG